MSEKGDIPSDTVSLPPTYAPSETYTESPPPAYRREKSSRVAIVRMVCITVVASALIIGFFVLTSNYLSARACNCGQTLQGKVDVLDVPRVGSLVALPPKAEGSDGEGKLLDDDAMKEVQTNVLEEEEEAPPHPEDDQVVIDTIPITEEELRAAEKIVEEEQEEEERELVEAARMEEEEEEEEALQDIMRAQAEHMKKIRLPIDLILGNPALAGRDVDCQVERRQQPLGGGIVSQAIIVTCSDDDEDQGLPRGGPVRHGPPLSLLEPIMKMLSARAAASSRTSRKPIPMGPMPCPGPFPCVMGRTNKLSEPPFPQGGPVLSRLPPPPFRPIVRMTPRFMAPPKEHSPPLSLASLRRGALPLPQRPDVRKMIQHLVPEARGRALPDPVSLPGAVRRIPGARLIAPAPLSGPLQRTGVENRLPITHMEMRAPPKAPSMPRMVEFGPPRLHTVIRARPQKAASSPKVFPILPIPGDVMTPPRPIAIISKALPIAGHRTPPPPPPSFDPNGRSGVVEGIEPDAEMVDRPQRLPQHLILPPQQPPQHQLPPKGVPQHLILPPQQPPQHQVPPQHQGPPQGVPQHLILPPQQPPQHQGPPQGVPQHLILPHGPPPQEPPQHHGPPHEPPQHQGPPQDKPQHQEPPQHREPPQDPPQHQGPPQDQPEGPEDEGKHHLLLVN